MKKYKEFLNEGTYINSKAIDREGNMLTWDKLKEIMLILECYISDEIYYNMGNMRDMVFYEGKLKLKLPDSQVYWTVLDDIKIHNIFENIIPYLEDKDLVEEYQELITDLKIVVLLLSKYNTNLILVQTSGLGQFVSIHKNIDYSIVVQRRK